MTPPDLWRQRLNSCGAELLARARVLEHLDNITDEVEWRHATLDILFPLIQPIVAVAEITLGPSPFSALVDDHVRAAMQVWVVLSIHLFSCLV